VRAQRAKAPKGRYRRHFATNSVRVRGTLICRVSLVPERYSCDRFVIDLAEISKPENAEKSALSYLGQPA